MRESVPGRDLPLGARNVEGPAVPYPLQQESDVPSVDEQDDGDKFTKQGDSQKGRKSAILEILETLVLAFIIFVGVRSIVLNFRVDGQSMEPNLVNGEMLIVNRRAYSHFDISWLPWVSDSSGDWYPFGKPARGDIIVFDPPAPHNEPYIKRIIGLPGDRISVHDGAVYINDQRLEETYLTSDTEWPGRAVRDIVVSPGHIFVMGDNRNNSSDSRVFGQVPISSVIGKAWVAYWPLSQVKLVSDPAYSFAR